MTSVLCLSHGLIFIDYFQKGKIVNNEYYANLLQHLSDETKKKQPDLFHQDNAPVYTSVIAVVKVNEFKFQIAFVPYLPDLPPPPPPSRFFSLSKLEKITRWKDL